ncbi:unnamed protein product [Cladocopium goreaui]|uniref:Methyltransferase FkbM domain-containing protein n=1 Tax=Cladocopium goreaui TaxID=2562237 RepID=A0A9P1M6B8_9DINO|nr:unnamed protein product [Cladocopium goreaui]
MTPIFPQEIMDVDRYKRPGVMSPVKLHRSSAKMAVVTSGLTSYDRIDCDGMINSASAQSDASQWQQLDFMAPVEGLGAINWQDWFVYKNFFRGSSLDVAGTLALPSCELVKNCVWSHPRRVVMSFQKDPIEAYIREDETHDGSQTDSSGSSGAVKITGGGSRPEFVAECRTLKDILASQGLGRPKLVDFLSVDAEAAEAGHGNATPGRVGELLDNLRIYR